MAPSVPDQPTMKAAPAPVTPEQPTLKATPGQVTPEQPTIKAGPAQPAHSQFEQPTVQAKQPFGAATPEQPTLKASPVNVPAFTSESRTASRSGAKLTIQHGGRTGYEFSITQESVTLGRWDPDSGAFPEIDLTEDDPGNYLSRKHARIFHKDNNYHIEDLGSSNGTFINKGKRLTKGSDYILQDNDEIIMGKIFLSFTLEK